MRLLQWLVGPDADAIDLLVSALKSGFKRIVVKRPTHARPLGQQDTLDISHSGSLEHENSPLPDQRFSSKLIHYDVYLHS